MGLGARQSFMRPAFGSSVQEGKAKELASFMYCLSASKQKLPTGWVTGQGGGSSAVELRR